MQKEGKLVIFSAPSGSGKTTLMRAMLEKDLNLHFSISASTREPREGETNGKDYYFLSVKAFKNHIDKGDFLEYEEVYPGQFYGTLRSEVERIWNEGGHVIFDIDVIGGLNLKKQYGKQALAIFVKAPSLKAIEERLRSRNTDTEEKLAIRLKKAASEMEYASQFDEIIINDNLDEAIDASYNIIRNFLNS